MDLCNAEVLFPYLNGEDLNSRPDCSASRWVIDFNDASLAVASQWKIPFQRVESLVYPERQKVNRKAHRERWWQYGDKRPALRKAIADLDEVLAIARISKTAMPVRVPTHQVFNERSWCLRPIHMHCRPCSHRRFTKHGLSSTGPRCERTSSTRLRMCSKRIHGQCRLVGSNRSVARLTESAVRSCFAAISA